jgi:hypothetical protein
MALNISHKLARLIRDRAYAGGALRRAERQAHKLQGQLTVAEGEHAAASAAVAKLDEQLAAYLSIDPTQIRQIGRTPRRVQLRFGAFNAELVRYLRDAGRPVSTQEIILQMETVFSLPPAFGEERDLRRRKTARRLRGFAARGVVRRLHDPSDNQVGLWAWVKA